MIIKVGQKKSTMGKPTALPLAEPGFLTSLPGMARITVMTVNSKYWHLTIKKWEPAVFSLQCFFRVMK